MWPTCVGGRADKLDQPSSIEEARHPDRLYGRRLDRVKRVPMSALMSCDWLMLADPRVGHIND